MLQGARAEAWLPAKARPRQQAVEGHAPSVLDGGRHRLRRLADGDDGGKPVQRLGLDAGQDRQEVDAAEGRRAGQHLGARAADDVGDLDGAIARVDRDGDGAKPRAGEIEDGISRDVGQPQRHAIARPDAEIAEALRGPRGAVEQLGEAQPPLALDEGGRVGCCIGDVGEQRPDVGGGMGERHAARRLAQQPVRSSRWSTARNRAGAAGTARGQA